MSAFGLSSAARHGSCFPPHMEALPTEKHKLYEDALAVGLGTLFVALGMLIYAKATLLIGSTAGVALLLQYVTGAPFWLVFSVVNVPFYVLAVLRMGWMFAARTMVAVTLVSLFSKFSPSWVGFSKLDPLFAAVTGGGLIGFGLLMLFRHRTGVGGVNILAIYLQERFGFRAGYFQLGVDMALLAVACFVLTPEHLALSVVGAAVANAVVAINHKPGRYLGVT